MAATPKKQRSKRRQRNVRGTWDYKHIGKPALVKKKNGRKVPKNLVTPENPSKDGVVFLPPKKKKLAQAA